jgi:hypothetical protein
VAAGFRDAPGDAPDCYLGLLSSEESLRVYGFETNCRARLLLGVQAEGAPPPGDEALRAVRGVRLRVVVRQRPLHLPPLAMP